MPEPKENKPTFLDDKNKEREAMYDKVYPVPPEKPGATDYKPVTVQPAPVQPAAPAAPAVTPAPKEETPPPADPKAETPGKPEQKTVPLEALHEARKDVQDLKKENGELKEQVKILLADMKELHKQLDQKPKEDDPVLGDTDYDKELKRLKDEVKALKEKDQTREKTAEEQRKEQEQKEAHAKLEVTLKDVDVALAAEGFKGFLDFLPMVSEHIRKIGLTDIDAAKALDNPEGWKKIFKENVFPKVSGVSAQELKDKKKAEKVALKDGAAVLVPASDAAATQAAGDKEEWTYQKYMEERRKRSLQPQA